jgi:hypothetical protein
MVGSSYSKRLAVGVGRLIQKILENTVFKDFFDDKNTEKSGCFLTLGKESDIIVAHATVANETILIKRNDDVQIHENAQ